MDKIKFASLRRICQLPAYVAHEKGFLRVAEATSPGSRLYVHLIETNRRGRRGVVDYFSS